MRKKNLPFLAMVLGDVKRGKLSFAKMYGRGADLVPLEELLYPEVVRIARKHVGGD